MNKKSYDSIEIRNLDKSRVEITGSISPEIYGSFRAKALKNINGDIALDGFRKGMVPENILVAKVGGMTILQEIAEIALNRAYIDILMDKKIEAIGQPQISVTKLAENNPIEFKITIAVIPNFTLPNYKSLAKKEISVVGEIKSEVSESEIEEAITRIRKAHASHEGHDHSKMTAEEHDKAVMENLPELNDEFVKRIGDFANVSAFRDKVSEMLVEENKKSHKEKLRIKIADAIAEATNIEIPDVMVESELKRIKSQFEADIANMGFKVEDYLSHSKKTMTDLENDWRPSAVKKVKLQLILNKISTEEKIVPSQKDIEAEIEHLIAHYIDADREVAHTYAETVLTNELVFQFLETV